MVLHDLTPIGPFFIGAAGVGGAITAVLAAVRPRVGIVALFGIAGAIAVLLAVVPGLIVGGTPAFGEAIRFLLPTVGILAGLVAVHPPARSVWRVAQVSLEGAIAFMLLAFGGTLFRILIVAALVVVAVRQRARRRITAERESLAHPAPRPPT